ncbi:MAG: hypothetical protein ACQESP_06030 [Candidatus Muiribacteriota bacterium]
MKRKIFNTTIVLLLITAFFLITEVKQDLVFFETCDRQYFIELATELNINNMVTSVYLGPRILDTFFEALVVIATAMAMNNMWRRP